VPFAKADHGTSPDFGLCRELWTGRRSATSRQRSGTQACHMHQGNQRDGSSGQKLGWKLCVKDKWVKQESRTLDPEWRDSAGHAQKGNNGSRRPYIRPQSAGSCISRLRGVKLSRSVKIPKRTVRQPSKLQGSHNKASRRKQRRGKPTRRSGLGHLESPS